MSERVSARASERARQCRLFCSGEAALCAGKPGCHGLSATAGRARSGECDFGPARLKSAAAWRSSFNRRLTNGAAYLHW
jgi:hypothetical protein